MLMALPSIQIVAELLLNEKRVLSLGELRAKTAIQGLLHLPRDKISDH